MDMSRRPIENLIRGLDYHLYDLALQEGRFFEAEQIWQQVAQAVAAHQPFDPQLPRG
jgi:hypothetical protein